MTYLKILLVHITDVKEYTTYDTFNDVHTMH